MIGPPEPHRHPRPQPERPVPGAARCLLLADGEEIGPALLASLRRQRSRDLDSSVHVVVPLRPALAGALAVGDPLAGWIVVDARAAHEWEQASRQDARRRLHELLWLLWEMDISATGEVLPEAAVDALLRGSSGVYSTVLVIRARFPLARWRQSRWLRRQQRGDREIEVVDEARLRRDR
jgi:hypothetical protein